MRPGSAAEQTPGAGSEVPAAVGTGTGGWSTPGGPALESRAGEASGAELDREEAGAEIDSDTAAGAGVAGADMEAGAETVETGAAEVARGAEEEALIPLKDPDRCDPSMSMWTKETDTGLLRSLTSNITHGHFY